MNIIIVSTLVLGLVGVLCALILGFTAKKFHVHEDERIDEIEALLPGANCGGCGFSGCRDFARTCVSRESLAGMTCPATAQTTMEKIASIIGVASEAKKPMVAVLKCNGSCDRRHRVATYDGARKCSIVNAVGGAEYSCAFGCLGCGDCVEACRFGALTMNPASGLPVVDDTKCTGCAMCVKACPRSLFELRFKGPRGLRVWVGCSNRNRGPVARKECTAACIACGKCVKVCPHEAITITDNVAYIDFNKCKLCKKCVGECPTGAILTANFPKPKTENQDK